MRKLESEELAKVANSVFYYPRMKNRIRMVHKGSAKLLPKYIGFMSFSTKKGHIFAETFFSRFETSNLFGMYFNDNYAW